MTTDSYNYDGMAQKPPIFISAIILTSMVSSVKHVISCMQDACARHRD